MLDAHGFGDLHRDLNRMSKAGRWAEMAALIPDEFVEADRGGRPARTRSRARSRPGRSGITDRVSLVNNRNPDPALFADIVADLRALG